MLYNDILVVQVRAPDFSFVLAARGEHASGGGINWPLNHLANEAKLPRSYHILDARYIIEHLSNLLLSYLALFDITH